MTFISLTEACRRLGIDAKTLHRWLAEAQLALQSHRVDGRKKGLSEEHLAVLARVHHRHLAGTEPAEAAPLPTLPPEVLALPEQVAALHAELVSLRASVTALTSLLTEPKAQPDPERGSSKPQPKSTAKPNAPSARSSPAKSAQAKKPAKPVRVIPRVEYVSEGHYVVICPKQGILPFEPDTQEWFAWVTKQSSFRFVGKGGHFTACHWWRVPHGAWRAHRHIRNRVHSLRLAPNHELTIAVLEQAAQALQAHLT